MNIKTRLDRLELQQQDDDTEWRHGLLPLAGDDYPSFWIPGPDGARRVVRIDEFV